MVPVFNNNTVKGLTVASMYSSCIPVQDQFHVWVTTTEAYAITITERSAPLCRELVCITVKWTWYNGREIFFYITSGRINTWKGVNLLKELFSSWFNYHFLNIYLKLTNHRYFIIKNPLFFTINKKNGVPRSADRQRLVSSSLTGRQPRDSRQLWLSHEMSYFRV